MTPPYVIRLMAMAGQEPPEPTFLRSLDVDARDGLGHVEMTARADRAQRFDSPGDALRTWRSQSSVRPVRDDGKPNRPLTAFTVEVLQLCDALAAEAAATD